MEGPPRDVARGRIDRRRGLAGYQWVRELLVYFVCRAEQEKQLVTQCFVVRCKWTLPKHNVCLLIGLGSWEN